MPSVHEGFICLCQIRPSVPALKGHSGRIPRYQSFAPHALPSLPSNSFFSFSKHLAPLPFSHLLSFPSSYNADVILLHFFPPPCLQLTPLKNKAKNKTRWNHCLMQLLWSPSSREKMPSFTLVSLLHLHINPQGPGLLSGARDQ